jgi:NitT/TauT family transport system permease protein
LAKRLAARAAVSINEQVAGTVIWNLRGDRSLSIDALETTQTTAESAPSRPASSTATVSFGRATATVSSAPLAALAALAIHRYLSDRQLVPMSWVDELPDWLHPYPILLEALLAAFLFLALVQYFWRPVRPWAHHYTPLAAGFLCALGLWELLTTKLNWMHLPYFMGPDTVLASLIDDRELLFESAWHSLLLLSCGYAAGVLAGLVTGVLIGWFTRARYWLMPIMRVIGPIPATALIPLVMTLSPNAFISGMWLIGMAVWFPMTMLTSSGIANVRVSYLDVARTLGAGRAYLIFRVALPAALPHIFIGMFIGLLTSFLTLIVAETLGVKAGLGWYLKWQQGYVEYAKVYASLIIMACFFSTVMTLLFKVRDYMLKWQKGVIQW